MKPILVSIIVPVYNCEKYINRCINSILDQTYNNFELILVNDGSTDNTKNIIKKIKDSRIKLYNLENNGVSNARNYGIDKAKGDYIMFVDADDTLDNNAISILVDKALTSSADIIRFNGYMQDKNDNFSVIRMPIENNKIIVSDDNEEKIIKLLNSPYNSISCYCWLLFIKNKNIKKFNIKLSYLEDKVFYLENMLSKNKTILFIDEKLYYYYYNEQSKTKNINHFIENIDDLLDANEEISKIINNKLKNEFTSVNDSIISLIIYRLEYLCSITNYKRFKSIVNIVSCNERVKKIFKPKSINLKKFQKFQYKMFKTRKFLLFYFSCSIKTFVKKIRGRG